nr:ribonuclease P protein component [Nitrosophilus alvini]
MKEYEPLKTSGEFNFIYKKGKSCHTRYFVLFYKENGKKKVGFVASKKVGSAVKRNRAKRRLRALFAQYSDNLKNGMYILVAKSALLEADFSKLRQSFENILKREKLLEKI